MVDQSGTLLGKAVVYPQAYDPAILYGIDREEGRKLLELDSRDVSFKGADQWTCYELGWLDSAGKPHVSIGEFTVPCESSNIVESKSLKLYLNSLNEHRFDSIADLNTTITTDISRVCDARVKVYIYSIDQYVQKGLHRIPGHCLDGMEIECTAALPNANLLLTLDDSTLRDEVLYSHLLKSNCPVTGQPDWASVQISYRGRGISHQSLLAYIVAFRHHQGFHEQCVEKMFVDISEQCKPESLTVMARYTRRGGIDINPWRSSGVLAPQSLRLGRQ